jgi:hypothetical protein
MSEIPDWLAENYEAIVADKNRAISYDSLAGIADAKGDKALAGWARSRAASTKKDVTPRTAEAPTPKSKR